MYLSRLAMLPLTMHEPRRNLGEHIHRPVLADNRPSGRDEEAIVTEPCAKAMDDNAETATGGNHLFSFAGRRAYVVQLKSLSREPPTSVVVNAGPVRRKHSQSECVVGGVRFLQTPSILDEVRLRVWRPASVKRHNY